MALGFLPNAPLQYTYIVDNVQGHAAGPGNPNTECGHDDHVIYVFGAIADMDGDGVWGTAGFIAHSEKGMLKRTGNSSYMAVEAGTTNLIPPELVCPQCVDYPD